MKKLILPLVSLFSCWLMTAQFGPQQVISTTTMSPRYLLAQDIDGDGATDVFCYSGDDYKMRWFRNLDGQGDFSDEIIISENTAFYISIDFVDIDSDGDKDLIYLENNPRKIEWLENLDGQGNFGPIQVILENQSDYMFNFKAIDIDNDTDADLVVHYSNSFFDWIVWYENLDGQGTYGEEILLIEGLVAAYEPIIVDIDNDGYLDIVTSTEINGPAKAIWFKNLGDVTFGEEQEIFHFDFFQSDQTSITHLEYIDVNTDNKKDFVVVGYNDDFGFFRFWIENMDNQGNFETTHPLTLIDDFFDMDNDGDIDILTNNADSVYWIENIDGLGTFSTQHIVDDNTTFSYGSYAAFINEDGLLDVIITSPYEDKIAWYENGVLGIEDNIKNHFNIYPNPTNGKLQINSNNEIVLIEVYNLVGQKVLETKAEINLSNLRPGIYFVKIEDNNGFSETHKVIKE